MMEHETRVSLGPVSHGLDGGPLPERSWVLAGDDFLLRADGAHWLHYRRGRGVTIERGAGADIAAEPLWRAGTLHAAVAAINGLVPLHASAVAIDGAAYAFTGPSGAGKSTLVAALGALGWPMVCDDTLVLDPGRGDGPPTCLPGHKRLKLAPEAVAATGSTAQERVSPAIGKVYAAPPAGDCDAPLPLAHLFVLEDGEPLRIAPIIGGARLLALLGDHYTTEVLCAVHGHDPAALFAQAAALAPRIAMSRLTRPRDLARLPEVAAHVAAAMRTVMKELA